MNRKIEKKYIILDGYRTETFYEFMDGMQQKLKHISEWARIAWVEVEEGNNIETAQMRLNAIQYLSESMSREVDVLFGVYNENSTMMELREAARQVEKDDKAEEKAAGEGR